MAEVLEARIQKLLDQRLELVDRLSNLDSLKDETNNRVYIRIKKDYEAQLDEVLGSIGEEKGALVSKVEELTARIDKLERSHQEQSDAVDELQIRARLREHDENDPDFQKNLESVKNERNKTANELDLLRSELGELRKVLRDVDEATLGRAAAAASAKDADEDDISDSIDELELDDEIEQSVPDGVKCPSCNHMNPAQNPFCEECGAALGAEDEDFADDFDLIDDDELDL
jgi:prefoldin subunit 5